MKKLKDTFNHIYNYQMFTAANAMWTLYFMNQGNIALASFGVFLTAALAAKGAKQHAADSLSVHPQQPLPRHEHKS